ncbi:energy-coupling factor transporter transmembrane component T family protein [Halorussus marinus]|uniref:energy-coupling factor transporter transmembrane component T family protein n=1 Tax=Halorussus marinus TaxID=2505976 RepID=UPI00106EE907|nr:energy-coupling factor transporter transmembrane component T [Halorussus marinus]
MSAAPTLYVDRDTFVHRLDPRAKLAMVLALFVAAYMFEHPLAVATPLAVALGVLALTGGLRKLGRIKVVITALFLAGFLVWPAYAPARGPVVVSTPVFDLTEYELLFALGRSERIVAFIVSGFAFITTTSNEEIVSGLRGLGVPYAFCFALGTALRLFPTFLGATGTVKQAQEARGLDLSAGGPLQRMRNYIPLLIPVLMTAVRNVNSQSMALEARGFDTDRERTFYDRRTFRAADWGVTALAVGVVVGVIGLWWLGVGQL